MANFSSGSMLYIYFFILFYFIFFIFFFWGVGELLSPPQLIHNLKTQFGTKF